MRGRSSTAGAMNEEKPCPWHTDEDAKVRRERLNQLMELAREYGLESLRSALREDAVPANERQIVDSWRKRSAA